jgi:hypothetical protein
MPMVKFNKAYIGTVAGTSWACDEGVEFNISAEEAAKIELDQPGTIEYTGKSETLDSPRPVTREKPVPQSKIGDYRVPTKTVTLEPQKLTEDEKTALAKATGEDVPDDAVATVRGLKVPKNDRMVKGADNRAEATQDASAPGAVSLQPEEVAKASGMVSSAGDGNTSTTTTPPPDAPKAS